MKPYSQFFVAVALLVAPGVAARAEKLGYHDIQADASGKIVPWYGTGPSQAYDHVIRLLFNFWKDMRQCPNGVPMYMQHQVWKPNEEDPRGLGGDQINMALSSWNLLYGYLGDTRVRDNMTYMADYWLAPGILGKADGGAPPPFLTTRAPPGGVSGGAGRAGGASHPPNKPPVGGGGGVGLKK